MSSPLQKAERVLEALKAVEWSGSFVWTNDRGLVPVCHHCRSAKGRPHVFGCIVSVALSDASSLLEDLRGREWMPIESAPKDGTPIHVYAPQEYDPDFNPTSCIDGYWQDGEGFIGATWNGTQDVWMTEVVAPTHWRPKPPPPASDTAEP